jgi:3-oxoacyl-[acyl-carrier protein] reductase
VNNAGIAGPNTRPGNIHWHGAVFFPSIWMDHFTVVALAPAMIAQKLRPYRQYRLHCRQRGQSAPAYSASKAGLIALTKSLGKELASYDISVNCITPALRKPRSRSDDARAYRLHALKIPRGRFVTVEEIAGLAAFCASSDCSFTTGAVFDISGGRATY